MTAIFKLTLPLNDVRESECAAGCGAAWTRRLTTSVIQRPQAVESPEEGQQPNSGRGRVALSSVILAKRGSPTEGQSSTLSLPRCNQRGDSRAERENDSRVSEPSSLPRQSHSGDSSVALLPLNDVQELRCAAGGVDNVDAETQILRHSEAAGRGIPHGGAHAQQWTWEGRLFHRHPREAGIPH